MLFDIGKAVFKSNTELNLVQIGSGFKFGNAEAIFEGITNISEQVFISGKGILNLNGGGGTALPGGRIDISNLGQVNFGEDFTFDENIQLNDAGSTVRVRSGKTVTIGNDLITVAGAQLSFDLNLTALPGQFTALNDANINGDEIVNIINPGLASYPIGVTGPATLITSTTGATIAAAPSLNAPNNLFISFDLSVDGTNKLLQLTGTRVIPTNLQNNIAGVADILGTVRTINATGDLVDLTNQLGLFYDISAQKEALASISPIHDNAFVQIVSDIQQDSDDLISKRIEEQFAGLNQYHTGYSAGFTNDQGNGSWVKLFGSSVKQDRRQNISGYQAGIWGIALGVDSKIADNALIGGSFSWANADINHKLSDSSTDINHYQGAIYARKNLENHLFLNGIISLAYNHFDVNHHLVVNDFNQINPVDFKGWQYAARAELGKNWQQDNFTLQPIFSLNYDYMNFNTYQEKGSSNTAQKINYDSVNSLIANLGLKILNEFTVQNFKFYREAHINIGYDLIGDKQKATAQFIDFGPAYQMTGVSPSRTDYNIGMSLTTYDNHGIGVNFGYDYHWKRDYHAHTGYLKLRYEWV